MIIAGLIVERAFPIADLDRRVFGTFVEHIGRCVYGGIYEPGQPTADADGLRGNVLALTRELGTTIVGYLGRPELSEQRRANGADEPFGVKFCCLGDEMHGPWQICGKTAQEYGGLAHEAAKVMRWVDPSVELAACGSSYREMTTYAAWEYEVLEHCFDDVEHLSLHTYLTNPTDDTADFFGTIERMDMFIKEVVAICDAVAVRRRSPKRIMLSFDEWNV